MQRATKICLLSNMIDSHHGQLHIYVGLLIFPQKYYLFLLHTNNNLIFGRKYFFFALIISVLLVSQTGLSNFFLLHSRLSEFIFHFKDF